MSHHIEDLQTVARLTADQEWLPDELGGEGGPGTGQVSDAGLGGFALRMTANAVLPATGKRVRDLPISPDEVFGRVFT